MTTKPKSTSKPILRKMSDMTEVMSAVKYKRIGDDTFLVLVEGQRPVKGRLKNWQNGLMNRGGGRFPSSRSDLKWLTDKEYHGK